MNLKRLSPVVLFMLSALPLGASANEPLTGEQISALISGKTFDGFTPKNGMASRIYADPNGDWYFSANSGKLAGKVQKWRWEVRGDEHCGIQNGEERCGKLYPQADGSYQKVRDGVPGFTISNIKDGNQLQ